MLGKGVDNINMKEAIKNQNNEDITQKVKATEEAVYGTVEKIDDVACGVLCISFLGCLFLLLAFIFFRNNFFFHGALLASILFLISSIVHGALLRSLGSE